MLMIIYVNIGMNCYILIMWLSGVNTVNSCIWRHGN